MDSFRSTSRTRKQQVGNCQKSGDHPRRSPQKTQQIRDVIPIQPESDRYTEEQAGGWRLEAGGKNLYAGTSRQRLTRATGTALGKPEHKAEKITLGVSLRSLTGVLGFFCFLVAACQPQTPVCDSTGNCTSEPQSENPATGGAPLDGDKAVIVFDAFVREGPGSGARYGLLKPGTVVTLGESTRRWQQIEVNDSSQIPVKGWVRKRLVGCRLLRDFNSPGGKVTLRAGALLSVRSEHGDTIEVETQDDISIRETIPRDSCGIGSPFVWIFPHDGPPHRLKKTAMLRADLGDEESIVKLNKGYRFVVFSREGSLASVRTDGTIVVKGFINYASLEPHKISPIDLLGEPLGYTHEALSKTALFEEPSGETITELPGGTPLNITEREGTWCQVRTYGLVQLEGWIEQVHLRRVSLDHNKLDPEARRRAHEPIYRGQLRGYDENEEDLELEEPVDPPK